MSWEKTARHSGRVEARSEGEGWRGVARWDCTLHDCRVVLPEEAVEVLVDKGHKAGGGQSLVVVVEDDKGRTQGVEA